MNYFEVLPPGHPRHWHSYARHGEVGIWDMARWCPSDWRCRIGQAIYTVARAFGRAADRIDPPGRSPL